MNNISEFNRLIEIIEDFKLVRDKTQLQITPDALFSNARALFISERIEQRQNQTKQFLSKEAPATDKQINFLKILKANIPPNLTKKEAIKLIQEKTEAENGNS